MQQSMFKRSKAELIDEYKRIFADAHIAYEGAINHSSIGYSGGHDSAVVAHIAMILNLPVSIMTIDTGIAQKGHLWRVYNDMQRLKSEWETRHGRFTKFQGFYIWTKPERDTKGKRHPDALGWYEQNVLDFGYGITPNQHSIYYRVLKEQALNSFVRSFKGRRGGKVAMLTGVRRLESVRRSSRPEFIEQPARVAINPILYFDEIDKSQFNISSWWQGRTTHDCLCNWTRRHTLDEMSPMVRQRIEAVNEQLRQVGMWGYGEEPTDKQRAMFLSGTDNADDMPEDGFCTNCLQKRLL